MKNNSTLYSSLFTTLMVVTGVFYMVSCEKEVEKPSGLNKIELSDPSAEIVTYNYAEITATLLGTDSNHVNITDHGFCWAETPEPDLNSSTKSIGRTTSLGTFAVELTDVEENTMYYIRPYASFNGGTLYGSTATFKTLEKGLPFVKTDSITAIASGSALCSSRVLSDGGYAITARGVCWNTTDSPTLQNCINFTTNGNGTGSFTSNITGLTPSTTYYVRAYATNSERTAYDIDDESFTTLAPWSCGAVLSITHNAGAIAPVNKTVNYGTVQSNLTGSNKCWITQNLGSDRQATSATDNAESSAGWYWQFNRKQGYKHDGSNRTPNTTWNSNISENSDWLTANDPCTLLLGSGWRLPTSTEWQTADNTGGWDNYNETYASVLKLHAAGYLSSIDGSLGYRSSSGHYWSSSQQVTDDYSLNLFFFSNYSNLDSYSKVNGFTARCLRD
ncbi:MAG: hypothetical protein JNL22_14205 [Bacteroidales bacterium]|nr:hypothetical protein [Bacteroidales bacterium]